MLRLSILLLTLAAAVSCNTTATQKEPFKTMLKGCNQVDIVFYNKGDTINYQTKDSAGIAILANSVLGINESVTNMCAPVGELRFKVHGQDTLTAQFATSHTKEKNKCSYITYALNGNKYLQKLTERADRVLNEIDTLHTKPSQPLLLKKDSL